MGGCTGWFALAIKNPETDSPTDEFFYQWPEERAHLNRFLTTVTSEDVYFSPLVFKSDRRTKANAREGSVIYSDADTCAPENFRIEPSVSVETSPGRWHCYWVLDSTYSAAQVSEVSHKIAIAHQDQGCDISGWHMSKLLRIPGTSNTNHGERFTVRAGYTGEVYSLEEMDKAYADIILPSEVEINASLELPDEWPELGPLLERIPKDSDLGKLYLEPWNAQRRAAGDDRSKIRWTLINTALECGFTPPETTVLAWTSSVNKYRDDGRRIEELFEQEVKKAASGNSKIPNERVIAALQDFTEGEESAPHTEDEFTDTVRFLTDAERQYMPRMITDDYVDWAASRTDSPACYQVANCLTILSGAFSDVAFIAPKQGAMGLNLWIQILGDTTATRKSTSRDLMLLMMHTLETSGIGYQIDIGSDLTKESLLKTLADRDGKTSLVHKDEVQGYFRETQGKAFRGGETETFTDLYGGKVPVVVRNDKENKSSGKRATTNFLLYFMGIPSEVAQVLSLDYFKSGFLARFVYVTASSPEMTEDREWVDQEEDFENDGTAIDYAFTDLVKRIANMRVKMKRTTGAYPMKLSREALVRWNKFKFDMGLATRGHRFFEAIEPSRQRLAFSVWKVAALLALSEGVSVIDLKHMIKAISYGEEWYANLCNLASQISASDWEGFLDQLEQSLSGAGKTRFTTVAKKFPGKKKRELEEALQSLVAQGRITDTTDPKTFVRYIMVGAID